MEAFQDDLNQAGNHKRICGASVIPGLRSRIIRFPDHCHKNHFIKVLVLMFNAKFKNQ